MNLLECYGVGIVTMDKETDTDEIQVYVKSLFPEADGETDTAIEVKNISTQSPTGNTYSSTTLRSNTVSAKWLPVNTNRITAPDVRNGSKVVVYKFKGQNTFRWTYFGMDGSLRLETIIYAFSASPNVNENSPVTADNYYMMLISTHTKKIQLITGQGNGEPTPYVIELDTGTGQFSIVDGEDNILSLDSMAHAFSFINQEKSFFNVEKKNISMSCPDGVLINGEKTITINSKTTTINSEDIFLNGNVTHKGNYTLIGKMDITGGFSQSGGAGVVSGGWTIDGFNYKGHTHSNGNDGKPTGGIVG